MAARQEQREGETVHSKRPFVCNAQRGVQTQKGHEQQCIGCQLESIAGPEKSRHALLCSCSMRRCAADRRRTVHVNGYTKSEIGVDLCPLSMHHETGVMMAQSHQSVLVYACVRMRTIQAQVGHFPAQQASIPQNGCLRSL